MAQKKHQKVRSLSSAELQTRLNRTMNHGQYQQALDLAKNLYRQESTPEHQALLSNVYLSRARQLRSQGKSRDAAGVLQVALQLEYADADWLKQVAEELAACGDSAAAMKVLEAVPDEDVRARVFAQAVDAAMREEAAGRQRLPAVLHEDFERIRKAFAEVETGQDAQARQTLQDIGLRSPFAEWKLLLRGLMAYYQKDDVRALENWQRLSPERLPAQLAAPFRFLIDSSYREAQPLAVQNLLHKQSDQLQGRGLVQQLRQIQAVLSSSDGLARAFRLAENLFPVLRQEAPALVPRLASCLYWAIVPSGGPEDVPRYLRVFGSPPDDPNFDRLQALAYENAGDMEEAHELWQRYERWVSARPEIWPAGQVDRVRAMLWEHMGRNAAHAADLDLLPLPPFLREQMPQPQPLKPSAEQCFERCLQLAPDWQEGYEALFQFYEQHRKDDQAEQTARRLLERFPTHVPTLVGLGDLCMRQGKAGEAIPLFQRALQANPLDRRLRSKLSTAHLFHARSFAEADQFEQARTQYQQALNLSDHTDDSSVFCKWAACEFKAGEEARAEELLRQAGTHRSSELSTTYSMLIEIIRLKLPRKLKTRFDRDFNRLLAETPSAASAAASADTTATHRLAGVTYVGQKTHEKKVLTYLEKVAPGEWTAEQLQTVCNALFGLKAQRLLTVYAQLGQRRFSNDPYFYFWEAKAGILMGPGRYSVPRLHHLLHQARELAGKLPPDTRREELLQQIREQESMLGMLNPFSNLFRGGMDGFFGDLFDEPPDDW